VEAEVSAVPDHVTLVGAVHVALSCATNAAGQIVCPNTSVGLFASLGVLLFVYLAIFVLSILAAVKIVTKAGYSGWWILITLVPLVGTLFIFLFAFSTWPVTREVQMLRAQLGEPRGYRGQRGAAGDGATPSQQVQGIPGFPAPGSSTPDHSPGGPAALPTFGAFITEGKVSVVTPPGASQVGATRATELPPAGWYPNPGDAEGHLRYWDGTNWTDNVRLP
jgi:uncharacterized membrane protein YhaH (DUF805 family)